MVRVYLDATEVYVPDWVIDLESFRRWSDDDSFPEVGHISFLRGEVRVDMSKEQLFTHNDVKSEFALVLRGLAKARRLGRYFGDGAYVSSVEADVSNQPDGCFVSSASLADGRVRIVEGATQGHVELEGSLDMVLEVVSTSSVQKDTVTLRRAYADAGVREYWLVDARAEPIRFDLLRWTERGYVATRRQGGRVWSEVFQHSFRLIQSTGEDGYPEFTLESSATR